MPFFVSVGVGAVARIVAGGTGAGAAIAKILFVQAVKDYAFEKTDYPVILSLENHCSMPQQQKMAE